MESKDVLIAFLKAWQNEDYEQMFEFAQTTWKDRNDENRLKVLYSIAHLKSFKVVSSSYVSGACMRYAVDLVLDNGDQVISSVMVICEIAPGKPAAWGTWGVNPVSVMNVVQKIPAKKPETKAKDVQTDPVKAETAKKPPVKKAAAKSKPNARK